MVTGSDREIAAPEIGGLTAQANALNLELMLPRDSASIVRSMIEERFPGLKYNCRRLRSSSGRNIVVNLRAENPGSHPSSIIVKCPASHRTSVQGNNHEVAGMQYLRALPHEDLARLAPEVYVQNPDHGSFAMEDLAVSRGARSLEDVLQSASPLDAAACLRVLARALGKLHLHTFLRRSGDSNSRPREQRSWLMPDFDRTVTVLRRKSRKFGGRLGAVELNELTVIDELLHRGGVSAFCHGDVSPTNVFISAQGIHFCDFESSGLLHPILEGIQLGWLFPFSLEAGGIPATVIEEMKMLYRSEFDFEGAVGRQMLDKVEAAAIVSFLLYHWVYTFPEGGLPIAYAGSRAKVMELMELLEERACGFHFPNLTQLLRHLQQSLAKEPSISPERSIIYECFRADASGPVALANNTEMPEYRSSQRISGIFRVNRSCHLVIRKCDSRNLSVYVLEFPRIHCTASRQGNSVFRGVEMPLELRYISRSKMAVRDLRTSKTINIRRRRFSIAVLRHLRQLREISRHHRAKISSQ